MEIKQNRKKGKKTEFQRKRKNSKKSLADKLHIVFEIYVQVLFKLQN